MKTLNELFREVILANELDNRLSLAYKFSDPDGSRSGKSGWSFGICQFDTQNNDQSIACLSECGFTHDEINGIVHQTIDVAPFKSRLQANAEIIARYDEAQLSLCINNAVNFNNNYHIPVVDSAALLAQADYVNQYGSMGNGMAAYLRSINGPIEAIHILDFKLNHTKYGKEHPSDCRRRYANIVKIAGGIYA